MLQCDAQVRVQHTKYTVVKVAPLCVVSASAPLALNAQGAPSRGAQRVWISFHPTLRYSEVEGCGCGRRWAACQARGSPHNPMQRCQACHDGKPQRKAALRL